MFEFSWPWVFVLLPTPLILISASGRYANRGIAVPPKLQQTLDTVHSQRSVQKFIEFLQLCLLWLSWFFLLCAIAQPFRPESIALQPASGRAMVLAADLSESMSKSDFTMNDHAVDRLTVVKAIAGQFIAARSGDRLGLVLFGDEAFIGSALSFDVKSVNDVLQSSGIGMAGKSTAIGDALGLAIQVLRNDSASEKAIILLSDGTNLAGSAEPEDAARLAAELDIRVHTIGLGSDDNISAGQLYLSSSADLDETTLKAIADSSGGRFFRARTAAELKQIYNVLDQLESTDEIAPPVIVKKDYRNLFVVALLMAMIVFLITKACRR